jgi:hypothetical protein
MGRIISITDTHYLVESNEPFYNKKTPFILNKNIRYFEHKDVEINKKDWFITKQRDLKIDSIIEI